MTRNKFFAMRYNVAIEVPYALDAYEQVTIEDRFRRELRSFLGDDKVEVLYFAEED